MKSIVGWGKTQRRPAKEALRAAVGASRNSASRPTLLSTPALTQFRSRVKKPGMFGQRIAIRHSGDEIRDLTGPHRRIGRRLPPWQVLRGVHVARKQVRQHGLGVTHDADDARMAVD